MTAAVQPRAVEYAGRAFRIPAAEVALNDGDRLALATISGGTFAYGGGRIAYDLSPGAVDIGLVHKGRCPVLLDHLFHMSSFIGGVAGVTVLSGQMQALCRFARTAAADEAWTLLAQGFPLSISAGGEIEHAEEAGDGTIRAVRWKLVELSVCVRGRDEQAGIRALEVHEDAAEMLARMNPDDPDGLGRRVALRRRLHLDSWNRWVDVAAPRLARATGADLDVVAAALGDLVTEHIADLERSLAA